MGKYSYNDLRNFVNEFYKYGRENNLSFRNMESEGQTFMEIIKNSIDKNGRAPMIYIDNNNKIRVVDDFSLKESTPEMIKGRKRLGKALEKNDSGKLINKIINVLEKNGYDLNRPNGGTFADIEWNAFENYMENNNFIYTRKTGNETYWYNGPEEFKEVINDKSGKRTSIITNSNNDTIVHETMPDGTHIFNKNNKERTVVKDGNAIKKGYSFKDSNNKEWTITDIILPDSSSNTNNISYIASSIGKSNIQFGGNNSTDIILSKEKVDKPSFTIDEIDNFNKLKDDLDEVASKYRNTRMNSEADPEVLKDMKDNLDNIIKEYVTEEEKIKQKIPDFERDMRTESYLSEFSPEHSNRRRRRRKNKKENSDTESQTKEVTSNQNINDTSTQYNIDQEKTDNKKTQPETKPKPNELDELANEHLNLNSQIKETLRTAENFNYILDEKEKLLDEYANGNISIEEYNKRQEELDKLISELFDESNSDSTKNEKENQDNSNSKPEPKQEPEPVDEVSDQVDKIEEAYNNGELTDEEYAEQLNNIYEEMNSQNKEPESKPQVEEGSSKPIPKANNEEIPGGIDFDSYDDGTFHPPEDIDMPTTTEEMIEYAKNEREKNMQKPQYNKETKPDYYTSSQVDQDKIDHIWNNLDPDMSIEDFMDQFSGLDGVTQRDIDIQKIKNRVKHNKKEGLSEQEAIDDIWKYINDNKLDVGLDDVKNIFHDDMGIEQYTPPKPQNPKPKFEDETIDIVNNNNNKNKQKQNKQPVKKTIWQQIKDTYKDIRDVLKNNRQAKRKKVFDVVRRGGYEELNVRTSQGRVNIIRNRKNGKIYTRSFVGTGKDQIQYQMGHGKNGRISYEVYRDSESGFFNYLRHYDKIPFTKRRWEHGNHIPTPTENPITGEKTVTKQVEDAFKEAGEIVKKIKGDQWTEMDEETFNFDIEKERDKYRNPQDGSWTPESYTKEEQDFLDAREQAFKDELDIAEEEWTGFKENNKGQERKLKNKINSLEKQLDDPNIPTAQKDKIRKKLAQYEDRLDNFENQKKALKDRRRKAKQDWNNRNTEGKINQELKNIEGSLPEGVDIDKFYEQYEKLKNTDISKLSSKEKYKYDNQLKRADALKKKIEDTTIKKSSLEKLKKNTLKSARNIENMSPSQIVKEIGVNGLISGLTAVGTYKDNRREGKSVLSSAVRAGADFVLSETLGAGAYMALNLVKEAPDLAVKGASALFKETRRLNSSSRFATFGDASFQDTQQLATMRQSGMELAKMSQYRLEQTLMGNEAKYLHR